MAVVDAFYSVPRGGVEIGGILIGSDNKRGVHIQGWRPIECLHASGPSFALSDGDRAALSAQLQSVVHQAQNSDLRPVGWFHSHTRSELFLSLQDLALFNEFFPGKRQVALLLRPKHQQPTVGSFFFREGDGKIRADSPYAEFEVAPLLLRRRTEPQAVPVEAAEPSERVAPQAVHKGATPPRIGQWRAWMLIFTTLLVVVAGAGALLRPYLNYDSSETLGLEAFDLDGQLLVRWNPMAQAVRQADTATLQIVDGVKKNTMELDRHMLRIGAVRYFRKSRRAEFTLTVPRNNKAPIEETMTFSAPVPDTPPNSDEMARRNRELEQEAAKLRKQVADWKRAWRKLADVKSVDGSAAPK